MKQKELSCETARRRRQGGEIVQSLAWNTVFWMKPNSALTQVHLVLGAASSVEWTLTHYEHCSLGNRPL